MCVCACVNECVCMFSFGCICDNALIMGRFCVNGIMCAFVYSRVLARKSMYAGMRT